MKGYTIKELVEALNSTQKTIDGLSNINDRNKSLDDVLIATIHARKELAYQIFRGENEL